MKKIKSLSIIVLSLIAFSISSCSKSQKAGAEDEVTDESGEGIRIIESEQEDADQDHSPGVPHVHYYCSDKCEGDKVYDEQGDCPVCEKSLLETSEEIH